jgi:hypothetical protein
VYHNIGPGVLIDEKEEDGSHVDSKIVAKDTDTKEFTLISNSVPELAAEEPLLESTNGAPSLPI